MFCRLGSKLLSPAMLNAQYASTGSNIKNTGTRAQTWLQVSLPVGSNLAEIIPTFLQPFGAMQVNVSNVLNNLHTLEGPAAHPGVFLDVDLHELDSRMPELLARLRTLSPNVSIIGSWCTVWYPTKPTDLDLLDQTTLAAGEELQDDPENPHPGFHDEVYRARRREVVSFAKDFKTGDAIPIIDYTEDERSVWRTVFDMLSELFPTNACHEFNQVLPRMIEGGVMSRMQVPQLAAVNDFLSEATGFTVRPVAGLLTSRDFLNALAFRVFFSTQYIRHHAQPLYTPEPDMVHDILGHTPLLADPDFAAFTQSIGFASLGASDQLIEELARVYWYSVEFGLCKESGGIRAYGAGVLSSPGELRRALGPEPERVPFDPFVAAKLPFPMTRYQPKYFVAGSFKEAQHLMEKWLEGWGKPFRVQYDSCTKTVQALPL